MGSFKMALCAITFYFIGAFLTYADVTKKVGPLASGGDYTTLKAAFDAINAGTIKNGVITLQIVGNTTESASAVLNDNGVGAAVYSSVKIYPTTAGFIISGSVSAAALVNINGANVVFDGSVGGIGSSKDLTIANTSTSASAGTYTISLGTAAHDVVVRNCVLKGSATSATGSAVLSLINASTTVSSYGNTISNNTITKGATACANGVLVSGTSARPITGCVISNNNIFDFSASGVYFPSATHASNNIYSGNKIYQTGNSTTAITGFNILNTGTGEQFLGNTISGITSTSTITIKGFYLNNYSSITLANNVINLTSSNASIIYGIHDNAPTGTSYALNLYFNTINIAGSGGSSYCYAKTNLPKVTIRNNIFVNQRSGTSYVLLYNSGFKTNLVSDHNDFYNASSGNIALIGGAAKTFDQLFNTTGESDSHNELPYFLSSSDLHIQTGPVSAVSGGGIPVAIITDLDGATRDDRFPDIGAYEYLADYYEFRGNTSPELDNKWETITNWSSRGIPSSSDNVVIPDHKTVNITSSPSSPAVCNNLTILPGTSISVNPGKAFTISGTVANAGSITLKADSLANSSLITNASGLRATVERSMKHARWELIATPLGDQDLSTFVSNSQNDVASSQDGVYRGFREYNTAFNKWSDFFTDTSVGAYGLLNLGQGYSLLRTGTTLTTTTPSKISFGEGTINVDPLTVTVARVGGNGWNCLGNPYTAPIALNENAQSTNNFLTLNADSLDPSFVAVYAWSDTSTVAYRIINNAAPASYLPVATGFFVKAKVLPISVSFTPDMRIHQSDINFRNTINNWYGLDLRASTKSGNLSTSIKMNSKMTDGLDISYDGGLMRMSNSYALYSKLIQDNGVDFAVQCITDTFKVAKLVPIGLDFAVGGNITFSANNLNLPEGVICILEDKVAGVNTELSIPGSTYSVNLPANTSNLGRFYVRMIQTIATGINALSNYVGIAVDKLTSEINVYGVTANNTTAFIYDSNGVARKTATLSCSPLNTISVRGLNKGIYILRIKNNQKEFVRKISL